MLFVFFFNDTATTEIYTLSLHDALPIWLPACHRGYCETEGESLRQGVPYPGQQPGHYQDNSRSEEHTSELQSLAYLVCRLLLEKKKISKDADHLGTALRALQLA